MRLSSSGCQWAEGLEDSLALHNLGPTPKPVDDFVLAAGVHGFPAIQYITDPAKQAILSRKGAPGRTFCVADDLPNCPPQAASARGCMCPSCVKSVY